MPSNVLVSGLSDTQYNGLYVYDGEVNGRSSYRLNENVRIFWQGVEWQLDDQSVGNTTGIDDVAYPWLVTNWVQNEIDPTGIVITEVPVSTQPTFGLPADVVALITSRFGTVANFLRLRNQGQV